MQFLFSRPYFHVFFKPVITVLSKEVNQTAAAEGNVIAEFSRLCSEFSLLDYRALHMVYGHTAFLLR